MVGAEVVGDDDFAGRPALVEQREDRLFEEICLIEGRDTDGEGATAWPSVAL